MVEAAFLVEVLFKLEKNFPYLEKNVIEPQRRQYSLPILNKFNDIIHSMVDDIKSIHCEIIDGKEKWKGSRVLTFEDPILYYLNHKEYFYSFISNGDIDLSNNISELYLRGIARYRDCMEFFNTEEGFQGFAIINSIIDNCKINNINPFYYILWVIANLKMRMESDRLNTISKDTDSSFKQTCKLPHNYQTIFDYIHPYGLDIWSYMNALREEENRIKDEFQELYSITS